jgi:hypothetical protein
MRSNKIENMYIQYFYSKMAIYPRIPIVLTNDSFINPWSLMSGKKYSVNTHLDQWKGTIKGTFSRYEKNKIMSKDEYVWSIVLIDWICDGDKHSCQADLYLDPIDNLKFYEIS